MRTCMDELAAILIGYGRSSLSWVCLTCLCSGRQRWRSAVDCGVGSCALRFGGTTTRPDVVAVAGDAKLMAAWRDLGLAVADTSHE